MGNDLKCVNRDSNFELMRITSMLMIILWHILVHGSVFYNSHGILSIILIFIKSVIIVHVNSYILVMGYYRCENRFRLSKLIQINNSVWFYKAVIALLFITFGLIEIKTISLIKYLSPISHYDYWFMTYYLLVYLLSPILNIIINNLSKSNYKKMLILLFMIFSIIPYFTNQEVINTNIGYGLIQFIFMYFLGAYFRKYDILNCYYLKKFSPEFKKILFICLFLFFGILSAFLVIASNSFFDLNSSTFDYIGNILKNSIEMYNPPFIILQSVFYFLFFSLLSFKNRIVNVLSSMTLGVYLIHDNAYIRGWLWPLLGFGNKQYYSCNILLNMFVATILVFIACFVIEFLRTRIFKFIYNRKISTKFRVWYRSYIDKMGFNIRW